MIRIIVCLALAMASFLGVVAVVADDIVTTPPIVIAQTPAAPQTVDLPVLTTPKAINEAISANDIIMQSFPAKRVNGSMIRDAAQIIGMAPKHPLQAGAPINQVDLMKEQLIRRGDDVSLLYHTGSLEINASGKALENGALGDSIKITNSGSNRTVDARVTGPKQAEIKE